MVAERQNLIDRHLVSRWSLSTKAYLESQRATYKRPCEPKEAREKYRRYCSVTVGDSSGQRFLEEPPRVYPTMPTLQGPRKGPALCIYPVTRQISLGSATYVLAGALTVPARTKGSNAGTEVPMDVRYQAPRSKIRGTVDNVVRLHTASNRAVRHYGI